MRCREEASHRSAPRSAGHVCSQAGNDGQPMLVLRAASHGKEWHSRRAVLWQASEKRVYIDNLQLLLKDPIRVFISECTHLLRRCICGSPIQMFQAHAVLAHQLSLHVCSLGALVWPVLLPACHSLLCQKRSGHVWTSRGSKTSRQAAEHLAINTAAYTESSAESCMLLRPSLPELLVCCWKTLAGRHTCALGSCQS